VLKADVKFSDVDCPDCGWPLCWVREVDKPKKQKRSLACGKKACAQEEKIKENDEETGNILLDEKRDF